MIERSWVRFLRPARSCQNYFPSWVNILFLLLFAFKVSKEPHPGATQNAGFPDLLYKTLARMNSLFEIHFALRLQSDPLVALGWSVSRHSSRTSIVHPKDAHLLNFR